MSLRNPFARWIVISAIWLPLCALGQSGGEATAAELRQLRKELQALRDRIEVLEAERRADERSGLRGEPPAPEERRTGTEPVPAEPESTLEVTGALRFNAFWETGDDGLQDRRGDSAFDLFRIGAKGTYKDILLSAEYRFYSYMHTLHHGWIGYQPNNRNWLEAGITQVPFGLLPYASHNYWFGIPYYLGLADDYDVGLKYVRETGPWNLQLAFFKNGEFGNPAKLDRYSFDVVSVGDYQNEETNQGNIRLAYTFGEGSDLINEVGLSAQYGGLRNRETGRTGDFSAYAFHWDFRYQRWNVQFQAIRQNYNPENPVGVSDDIIRLGAFATSYEVASEGTALVANIAYNLPVPFEFLDSVTAYNDFSAFLKDVDSFDDSYINTTGFAIGSGPIFVYLDFIQSWNMVFFDGGSFAGGGNDEWNLRANLNIGYYW